MLLEEALVPLLRTRTPTPENPELPDESTFLKGVGLNVPPPSPALEGLRTQPETEGAVRHTPAALVSIFPWRGPVWGQLQTWGSGKEMPALPPACTSLGTRERTPRAGRQGTPSSGLLLARGKGAGSRTSCSAQFSG